MTKEETCIREECLKPVHAKGECQPHYRQTKRRERGLRKPGKVANPDAPRSRYNENRGKDRKDISEAKLELLPPKRPHNRDKTHCDRGHELSGDNVRVNTNGSRKCRICEMISYRQLKYGVTEEEFNNLMEKQSASCALCLVPFDQSKSATKACVDHDHETGVVRGLLCNNCNQGIGLLKENLRTLSNAITYLGGVSSFNPPNFTVETVFSTRDLKDFVEEYHYLHSVDGVSGIYNFALMSDDQIVGAAIYGRFAGRRAEEKYPRSLELRRFVLLDGLPKNTATWFLSRTLRKIKGDPDYDSVIAYSDPRMGHEGTIYKAANFVDIGRSSLTYPIAYQGNEYHHRMLNGTSPLSQELRNALETGEAQRVSAPRKLIYEYNLR